MAIVSTPFADFCNITVPRDDFSAVLAGVDGVALQAGAVHGEVESSLRIGRYGTMKRAQRYGVGFFGFSGDALAQLREQGLLGAMLAEFSVAPHRVTTLHATLDVAEPAQAHLHRLFRRAQRVGIGLTAKSVRLSGIRRFLSASIIGSGQTGTLYIGKRHRDVSASVYDKRQQLLQRAIDEHGRSEQVISLNDPGPLTRFEVQLARKVGCTLSDVYDPAAVFWHFAGDALLPRPAGVPKWQPFAEGFSVERKEPDVHRQLELLLENSRDLQRMVELSEKLTRNREIAHKFLLGKLRRRIERGSSSVILASPKPA